MESPHLYRLELVDRSGRPLPGTNFEGSGDGAALSLPANAQWNASSVTIRFSNGMRVDCSFAKEHQNWNPYPLPTSSQAVAPISG
jgi:hypothetical protein